MSGYQYPTQLGGVGCRSADEGYGAHILAFEPGQRDEAAKIDEIIHSLTEPGRTTVVVDKESKIVRYSSDADFIGSQATDIGIPEDSVRERYMEDFWLGGKKIFTVFLPRQLDWYTMAFAMQTVWPGARWAMLSYGRRVHRYIPGQVPISVVRLYQQAE